MFEQDRFIVRLQQSVMRESAIQSCFLTGSYGRRAEDAYSDLDVVLLFADEAARDDAWANRRDFAQSVLPYVPAKSFDLEREGAYVHSALYGNGAKVDVRYETRASLQPDPADREVRILKDTAGWAEAYQAACARAVVAQPRLEASALERIDNGFWLLFWDVYRQLLRGEADKPFAVYLDLLHQTLPPLLRALPPEDPAYQGLVNVRYGRDPRATLDSLRELLDAYLAARAAVIRRHNVGFVPDDSFERAIRETMRRRRP